MKYGSHHILTPSIKKLDEFDASIGASQKSARTLLDNFWNCHEVEVSVERCANVSHRGIKKVYPVIFFLFWIVGVTSAISQDSRAILQTQTQLSVKKPAPRCDTIGTDVGEAVGVLVRLAVGVVVDCGGRCRGTCRRRCWVIHWGSCCRCCWASCWNCGWNKPQLKPYLEPWARC